MQENWFENLYKNIEVCLTQWRLNDSEAHHYADIPIILDKLRYYKIAVDNGEIFIKYEQTQLVPSFNLLMERVKVEIDNLQQYCKRKDWKQCRGVANRLSSNLFDLQRYVVEKRSLLPKQE